MEDATFTTPLQIITAGFDELCKTGTAQLGTGASVSLAARVEEALKAPGAAEALPSLNGTRADMLPAGAIVRFQGMVMDMRDPEYYGGVYEEVHADGSVHLRTGKFRDAFDVPAGCSIRPRNEFTWQRAPIICAPLPGQTAWAAAAIAGPAAAAAAAVAAPARSKRAAESDLAETAATEAAQDMDDDMAVEEPKRSRAVGGTETTDPLVCAPCEGDVGAGASSAWTRSAALGSVMVKIYDPHSDSSEEGSDLRLNELIEVYGVLDLGGDTDVAEGGATDGISMMVEEERALRPPPSAQPRLHCLYYRKLQAAKSHPLLPAPDTYEETLAFQLARHHVAATRSAIVSAFTSALSGDALCAELLLLSIISRVIARRGEVPIGKLPLNITGCPAGAAAGGPSPVFASLGAVLRELLPCVSEMPLSVERLNGARLIPQKDYEANILMQGELQLPAGATLLVDETSIAPGKLNEAGVKNLAALGDLVSRQKVAFDFKYFPVDFDADVSINSSDSWDTAQPQNFFSARHTIDRWIKISTSVCMYI